MLAEVDRYLAADQVVQGHYGRLEHHKFTGCFIGCTAHALYPDAEDFDNPGAVYKAYGFPEPLTRLCERIFENLPKGKHRAFFKDVPNALNLGADLSLVHWKFLDWMLQDLFENKDPEECAEALSVVHGLANGLAVTPERARYAVTRAASAAASDASNAVHAAATARAAAAASRVASYPSDWQKFASKLIEILKNAH